MLTAAPPIPVDPPPSLPELAPGDAARFDQLLAAQGCLFILAADSGQPLRDLMAWAASPSVAPWVAHFKSMRDNQLRREMFDYLRNVVHTTQDPIEGRRAASALLRHLSTPRPPSARTADRPRRLHTVPLSLGPRPTPPPPARETTPPPSRDQVFAPTDDPAMIPVRPTDPIPAPDITPAQVADHVLAALTAQDPSSPDSAIVLHNFLPDRALERDALAPQRTVEWLRGRTPAAFQIVSCTTLPLSTTPHSDWASREHEIRTADAQRLTLRLSLNRPSHGTFAGCWMLAGIATRPVEVPFSPYHPPHLDHFPKPSARGP